jgi:hypothetical protein
MSHPFRHELDAALARIEQLEGQLTEARRRGEATLRPPGRRFAFPSQLMLMLGLIFVGVGFSFAAVSRISGNDTAARIAAPPTLNGAAFLHSPIITVSPQGLSAWQIGNVASRHASEMNVACGGVLEPIQVSLELDIDVSGHVQRAEAHGPEQLARCTENQARFWQFPAADGVTHTSVPIYFRPSLASGTPVVRVPPDSSSIAQTGSIAVTCSPQCDAVLEDGAPIGRAPILSHPTTPGRHTLELISGTRKRTITVVVHAGRIAEVREDLTDSTDDLLGPL